MVKSPFSLSKEERVCSRKLIEQLFRHSTSKAFTAYPLRAVCMSGGQTQMTAPVQIMVSVPKRHFKHAVDRNRIKRQVREAYRKNKLLLDGMNEAAIAFVWMDHQLLSSSDVEKRTQHLLKRIKEANLQQA